MSLHALSAVNKDTIQYNTNEKLHKMELWYKNMQLLSTGNRYTETHILRMSLDSEYMGTSGKLDKIQDFIFNQIYRYR